MVMGDSFNSALFKQTFQRVFSKVRAIRFSVLVKSGGNECKPAPGFQCGKLLVLIKAGFNVKCGKKTNSNNGRTHCSDTSNEKFVIHSIESLESAALVNDKVTS